jgi:anaerobic magnesium-protoporphyrin IX monomethyl ester cyclase
LRVLLLNPPFVPRFSRAQRSPARTKSGNLYYPIWLGYATGALEQAGHDCRLLDAPARSLSLSDVVEAARDFDPEMLVVDTSTPSILNDLEVSRALKSALPKTFQVLVGTHASALADETMHGAPWVDAIARREYDATLRDLANGGIASASEVLGMTVRGGDSIIHTPQRKELTGKELDDLPFVTKVWHAHLSIRDYFYSITPYPQVTLVTGRGCPYKCEFCVWPQVLTGHQYRRRSVDNVVEEFQWIQKHLPGVHVFIEDDTLTVNQKRCIELAEALIRVNNKVQFTANSRADVDLQTLKALKAAGLRMVCTGFESADDGILANVQKRLKSDQAREFMKNAKKSGVMVHGCFMVGNPGETRETLGKTLQFACEVNPDSAQFFPLMVYPGTKAYDRAVSDGSLISRDWSQWLTADGLHNTVIDQPSLPASQLVAWCNHARRRFYLRPTYVSRKALQSLRHPREGARNIRAASELVRHLFRPVGG